MGRVYAIMTVTSLNELTSPHLKVSAIVGSLVFGGFFLAIVASLFYVGYLRNRRTSHPSDARRWPRLFNLRVHIDPTAQIFPASLRAISPAPGTRPFARHIARPGDELMRPPRYEYPPSYETVVSDHQEIAYPGAVYLSPDDAEAGARRTPTPISVIDSTIP